MKNIKNIIIAFVSILAISCTDDIQDTNREALAPETAPVLLTPTSTFNTVLQKANQNNLATSVVWNDATYSGTATVVNYTIEIAKAGTSFAKPVVVTSTTNRFKEITVGELNTAILTAGLVPFVEHQIDIRIKSSVGTTGTGTAQYSNSFAIKATPFPSWPNWGIIGDATPTGWGSDTNLDYDLATQKYSITIHLTAAHFKFRLDDSWDVNYGDDGNNGTLEAGGSDVPVAAEGDYKIVVDFTAKTYTITKL
ncbi:SusE domain-containing protein [Flavobacterium sp. XS2P12]|uniref:SusE domain-containing protein n=1 Tax=Flavobacterium melibiosi TaxID=3398734 RepID=UPI003A887F37